MKKQQYQNNGITHLVYEQVKLVPIGKVTTYKQIAIACGDKNLARVVRKCST